MKSIKLNPNSWVFKLQRFMFNYRPDEYEQDGCKLGWMLIFLPFIMLFAWPVAIIAKATKERRVNAFKASFSGFVIQVLGLIVGVVVTEELNITTSKADLIWMALIGIILVLAAAAIIIGLIASIWYFKEYLAERFPKKKKTYKEYKEPFIKTWIRAKKEKSCPRIDWEE